MTQSQFSDSNDRIPDDSMPFGPPASGDESVEQTINLSEFTLPPEIDEDESPGAEVYGPRLDNDFGRYTGFLRLGSGGAGLVRSCRDPNLGRVVAMKTLHARLGASPFQRTRFIQEAQIIAQLEHPNVVPVHELGLDEKEGTVYFTMKRVRGLTLQDVISGLREGIEDIVAEYSAHRVVEVFTQICQAVAFAHSKGVIHRDLKPENILLGSFGEVLVMDWGLAKVAGVDEQRDELGDGASGDGRTTMPGTISGTPLNMSPEQAMGDVAAIDERSDVFSLGTMLYQILTLERAFGGKDVPEILRNVIHQPVVPPRRKAPERNTPRELEAICLKALAKAREDRFPDVSSLVAEIQRYREGRPVACCPDAVPRRVLKWCRRHPVFSSAFTVGVAVLFIGGGALKIAEASHYRRLMATGDEHREKGKALVEKQEDALAQLKRMRTEHRRKTPHPLELAHAKDLEDLRNESKNRFEFAAMMYVMAGGNKATPRRRAAVLDIYSTRIDYARHAGHHREVARLLDLTREWLGPDFEKAESDEERAYFLEAAAYAGGDGTLAVRSEPPGAPATLARLEPDHRGVWVPREPRDLGRTPADALDLPKGRYLLTLADESGLDVLYPVWIEHAEEETAVVHLPDTIPEGTVYVPAGPFYAGGEAARYYRRHEVNLPAFFIRSTEVSFREYLAYWMDAEGGRRGREDMARVRLSHDIRAFQDAWDDEGRLIESFSPDGPVVGITQAAAARFCDWMGVKLGRSCRLPSAQEWEKAARGVDARSFVWGDEYDRTFAFTVENRPAIRKFAPFAPPRSFPVDRSVYGVYDMGGNVREWTSTLFTEESPFYQVKGASAATTKPFLFCAYSSDTPVVPTDIGFRYVLPWDERLDGE